MPWLLVVGGRRSGARHLTADHLVGFLLYAYTTMHGQIYIKFTSNTSNAFANQ
jgi:hypothetical protein